MSVRPKIQVLDQAGIDQVVEAAYNLLETFGVQIKDDEILKILADGGARVDFKEQVAFIPAKMVDRALATVPSSFSVFSQDQTQEAKLAGDEVHYAAGSLPVHLLDSETEIIRAPTIPDLISINRLIETLENLAFQTGPILPEGIPEPVQDVYRFLINMVHSNKPYFGGALSVEGMVCQIEMLEVLRGSRAELKSKPRVIFAANPSAPLSWGPIIARNLVDSAKASIPVMLIPMPLPGGTVPVTLAGTLTDHTAENLSGIVLSQLVNPGAPILYGGGAILLDMGTGMSCIGAIESHLLGSGYSLIGKHLNLPTASNIGQSDSQRVDSQAGLESGIGMIIAALSGINLSRGAGMLNFANCQSMEKLVIDNNICGMGLRLVKGIQVDPETIALTEYAKAGRGSQGHLTSRHTLDWFRKELFFPSPAINRRAARTGQRTSSAFERAREEVKERLTKHQPVPLEEEKRKELERIVLAYAKARGISKLPRIWPEYRPDEVIGG